ncbi:hypothetical protein DCAR_0104781 [Daucus carota subsp. sativus]|uniref:Exocyst subunit Exo70 family protein n=2 Tax=Daucus carota subsp. sativus TaxID=79200 RepID=A0AAF1AMK6_DAUCS|nr:hypothetical protein DCAR_0104781 [Daucus carota subsp. sativus]
MKTLQLVFKGILTFSISGTRSYLRSSTVYSSSVTSSSSYELQGSGYTVQGELSSEQVYRLQNIAERLNSTGCLGDCIEAYKISRKSAVDARFLRFGFGKWSIDDLQGLDSEEFTANIRLWIQTARKFYNSFFPGERQYYEQIFGGVSSVTYDNCFLPIVKEVAIELNNFANAVSSIASFQKLFAVLDLYKALSVLIPEIRNMFSTKLSAYISQGAIKTIENLATLVRQLFSSFEDTVLNERLNTLTRDGSIHSLTKYAMNYVTSISQYEELLKSIILSGPIESVGYQLDEQSLEDSGKSPLQLHLIWIMISLRINLEGKSRCHEHSSLRYVFIMNNVNYVIKTIIGSPELLELIGKEYVLKLSKDVIQATHFYSSSMWPRLLYCLRDPRLSNKFTFYDKLSKDSLKDRFKAFNTTFEEVCQTTSFVLDIQLRDQLHKFILRKLLPAYKCFLEKYGSHTLSKRYKEKYIKYSPEDLDYAFRTLTNDNGFSVEC